MRIAVIESEVSSIPQGTVASVFEPMCRRHRKHLVAAIHISPSGWMQMALACLGSRTTGHPLSPPDPSRLIWLSGHATQRHSRAFGTGLRNRNERRRGLSHLNRFSIAVCFDGHMQSD